MMLQSKSTRTWRYLDSLRAVCNMARVALLLLLGMVCAPAHASMKCEVQGMDLMPAAGSVTVPANTAAGTTLTTIDPATFKSVCTIQNDVSTYSDKVYLTFATTTSLVAGYTDVYPTNVKGIGIRYTFNSSQCSITDVVLANSTVKLPCAISGKAGEVITSDYTVTATLVSTGAVAAGTTELSTVPTITTKLSQASTGTNTWTKTSLYSGSATGTLVKITCSVSQPGVPVSLPDIKSSELSSGVGSTAGPKMFTLSFTCAAGAKVWITLTDNVKPANRSDTLQLTTDSTANGVGVQILNDIGPVSYGPDSAVAGNTNQWLIGDSPTGSLQVPLTARYIRTGTVAAGTVKALATFTMSYQ